MHVMPKHKSPLYMFVQEPPSQFHYPDSAHALAVVAASTLYSCGQSAQISADCCIQPTSGQHPAARYFQLCQCMLVNIQMRVAASVMPASFK